MYNIGYKQRLPVFINSSFNEENKFKVDLSICVCVAQVAQDILLLRCFIARFWWAAERGVFHLST